MRRRVLLLLILGSCLIALSLCCMLFVHIQLYKGTKECQKTVSAMCELLPDRTPGLVGMYPDPVMSVLEMNGTDYVALLEIPSMGIVLPIADKWNGIKLSASPARFSGSVYDNTFVAGGVDYPGQFSFCDEIENGTAITITDMTGAQFSYKVSRVDRSKQAQTQWLQNEKYPLTLFCGDMFSLEYVAVRCVLTYN